MTNGAKNLEEADFRYILKNYDLSEEFMALVAEHDRAQAGLAKHRAENEDCWNFFYDLQGFRQPRTPRVVTEAEEAALQKDRESLRAGGKVIDHDKFKPLQDARKKVSDYNRTQKLLAEFVNEAWQAIGAAWQAELPGMAEQSVPAADRALEDYRKAEAKFAEAKAALKQAVKNAVFAVTDGQIHAETETFMGSGGMGRTRQPDHAVWETRDGRMTVDCIRALEIGDWVNQGLPQVEPDPGIQPALTGWALLDHLREQEMEMIEEQSGKGLLTSTWFAEDKRKGRVKLVAGEYVRQEEQYWR